jgi:hypothetical protein
LIVSRIVRQYTDHYKAEQECRAYLCIGISDFYGLQYLQLDWKPIKDQAQFLQLLGILSCEVDRVVGNLVTRSRFPPHSPQFNTCMKPSSARMKCNFRIFPRHRVQLRTVSCRSRCAIRPGMAAHSNLSLRPDHKP